MKKKNIIPHTHRLYIVYREMKSRCYRATHKAYPKYGGRGIKICEEWLNDCNTFFKWSLDNGYSDELTIDRKDVNGDYSPENCRWATYKEQNNNKTDNVLITVNGVTKTVMEWSNDTGINYHTLRKRLLKGWTEDKILSPARFKRR